jgi:D-tyrosyl-tRNA(Tyr) deacylase
LSALSAALDVSLENLTLSSPNAKTAKVASQHDASNFNDQVPPHKTGSSGENVVAGGRDMSISLPREDSSPRPDPLLLLLVDDNVSEMAFDG